MEREKFIIHALLGTIGLTGACGPDFAETTEASKDPPRHSTKTSQKPRCPQYGGCPDEEVHSCFEFDTPILVQGTTGALEWIPASKVENGMRLASLDGNAVLTRPVLRAQSVRTISHDPAASDLRVLTFDNERHLKVTPNHPILLHDNRVVRADKLQVGDKLVNMDGSIARVSDITIEPTLRDVYNFVVDADTPMSHIIVAGGLLSPDLWWQERLTSVNHSVD